jgi:transposase InsO family protein
MSKRKHHTQETAAAMAGFSERTARRIERGTHQPAHNKPRTWRTRPDPFADVWDSELVPLLQHSPKLKAITLLTKLQETHPDRFPMSMRRTLERRVCLWRAQQGPEKEIFFPQEHLPGARGLSDFTSMNELQVTISCVPFKHLLYHFVFAFSHWEYAYVVEGGESFEALSEGLQSALWQAGGCPREHRTDSLSAAFKNLTQQEDFTTRYSALLEHYGMNGTRTNPGLAHENGSIESPHRHLKEAVDQALMLRGHRDFSNRADYDKFLHGVVMRRNRRNAAAFNAEREHLQPLPPQRTNGFVETEARVTRCSTFTVCGVLYSAPSRLIGHRLKVRLYLDRLDCYLSGALVHSTPRQVRTNNARPRALDYRHFVKALKRKPQAFKGLVFRDDLFPREAYRRAWEQLEARLAPRQACKIMVSLLELAAYHGVEATLAERLDATLAAGQLPDIKQLRLEVIVPLSPYPELSIETPNLAIYDNLLEEGARI